MTTSLFLKKTTFIVLICITCTTTNNIKAQHKNWPQFRGRNASGLAGKDAKPPIHFSMNQNLLWKTALPVGHSSPCIWGDAIVLTGYVTENKELQTICIDRNTGDIHQVSAPPFFKITRYS